MDRFLIVANPLREREDRVEYILRPVPPRVLISVTPIFAGELGHDEVAEPDGYGKIFHSNFLNGDFNSARLKIEIDLQAEGNGKHVPLNPQLEMVLSRAWRWFIAFKLKTSRMTHEHNLPDWMLR